VQALKQLPREQVQVATKFGIRRDESGTRTVCGRPEYVRACCEASLRRLDIDCIDLYYQHHIDTTIPIEETVDTFYLPSSSRWLVCLLMLILCSKLLQIGELKKLEEGKVKYIDCQRLVRGEPRHH